MAVDSQQLEAKLVDMYPEIRKHGVNLSLNFDSFKKAWVVKLSGGQHELTTHLDEKDAESCLEGVECVYFGVQIGQFLKNFEISD